MQKLQRHLSSRPPGSLVVLVKPGILPGFFPHQPPKFISGQAAQTPKSTWDSEQ